MRAAPALTERLVAVARAAQAAGHGGKGAVYDAACAELGMARGTLLRKLKEVVVATPRKRRSDAGTTALARDEAMTISALLMESTRKNGKRLYSVADAVETLRANRMIRAESIDMDTGELFPLSVSAITRALRGYGLHPEQLMAPAPVTEQASRHPNHVWEIDASLCVLYYLKPQADARSNGLRVMDHREFYKNKPRNLDRIAADRVWSYEITDHASGWIYVEYVMGAESGENLCSVLINAMQERTQDGCADVLHGVPSILYMDKGSGNTAGMTRNLCRALGIEILVHATGNARATGQVEKARDIIERKFEPGLKFQAVGSLDELNGLARRWRMHFNATAVHSRHGKTRSAAWMEITAGQLVKAPAVAVCRELAVAAPESRKVTPKLRVSFRGTEYDVSTVPDVMVGETLMVTRNPWRDNAAQVVLVGDDGHEVFHVVDEVAKNDWGFATAAAYIGEEYRRPTDTPAQTAIKEIEQLVTGTDSVAAAEAARKAKALPFGGQIDPYKHIDTATLPSYLPRRGTASDAVAPTVIPPAEPKLGYQIAVPDAVSVEARPLNHIQMAMAFSKRIPGWNAEFYERMTQLFPDGCMEADLDGVAMRIQQQDQDKGPHLIAVA